MKNPVIVGTGSYAPGQQVTNDHLSQLVDTSHQWIVDRTGICSRHLSQGEGTADLAIEAGRRALTNGGIEPEAVDLIIVATMSPDAFMPATACRVQEALGAINATCFDLSAACTGFIYGLHLAAQCIRSGAHNTALVIGAEVLSKLLNWSDRNTCVLFGDGAGAVVLQGKEAPGVFISYTGSDGTGGDLLQCPAVGVSSPFAPLGREVASQISMDGREVFKFALKTLTKSIQAVLSQGNCSLEEVRAIIPHQANRRIIEGAAKLLGAPLEQFYLNLDHYGNTSAASIPLALDEMARKGLLSPGDKLVLVGFGGGLTWGSILLEW